MNKKLVLLALCTVSLPAVFAACSSPADDAAPKPANAPNTSASNPSPNGDQAAGTGGDGNTQNHMEQPTEGSNPNATNVEQKKQDEAAVGSTNIVARLHACGKVNYDSLGAFLASRGVDLAAADGAGRLWREGRLALGAPNYRARISEASFPSTAAFNKMFDIYALAASEIRTNLDTSEACPGVAAVGEDGRLTADAVSCIIGLPATPNHVVLANFFVDDAAYADRKEEAADIGIATLLTSHELCE